MAPSPLARKLLVEPGHRMAVVNAPEGYRGQLEPLPDGAEVADALAPGKVGR